jgi:hypothetical protein
MENPINETLFDSRDLIAYLRALQEEIEQDLEDNIDELVDKPSEEQQDHYEQVKTFVEELEGYSDFHHGEAIICEDYFTTYTRELIKDCGYIKDDFPWWIAVDWDKTAENIKVDYISVSYQEKDYYMRA